MHVLLTGGTGYFGKSILAWLKSNNHSLSKLTITSRSPHNLKDIFDFNEFSFDIELVSHDICTVLDYKDPVDVIIHAAADSSKNLAKSNPFLASQVIVEGTKTILSFARDHGVKRVLHISSGGVYGKLNHQVSYVKESHCLCPDSMQDSSAYGIAKRYSENLCALFHKQYGLDVLVARCFAFVGPYLPLDVHFAIGNFIKNGLNNEDIVIKGDGCAVRSYMYSDDLVECLFKLIDYGKAGHAYNVGSDEAISIKNLAERVNECFDNSLNVIVQNQAGFSDDVYVPNIDKLKKDLNFYPSIFLTEAIKKTIQYHKLSNK